MSRSVVIQQPGRYGHSLGSNGGVYATGHPRSPSQDFGYGRGNSGYGSPGYSKDDPEDHSLRDMDGKQMTVLSHDYRLDQELEDLLKSEIVYIQQQMPIDLKG